MPLPGVVTVDGVKGEFNDPDYNLSDEGDDFQDVIDDQQVRKVRGRPKNASVNVSSSSGILVPLQNADVESNYASSDELPDVDVQSDKEEDKGQENNIYEKYDEGQHKNVPRYGIYTEPSFISGIGGGVSSALHDNPLVARDFVNEEVPCSSEGPDAELVFQDQVVDVHVLDPDALQPSATADEDSNALQPAVIAVYPVISEDMLMDGEKGVITIDSLKKNSVLMGLQDFSEEELKNMIREAIQMVMELLIRVNFVF
ncbi:centrin, EF-hand protein [Datura stramonium]|uniref:Centrin, EF-hand protein n=1 Tax=Datura stramonium TaxID=4076 RepID=A0ABS8UPJ6_DATST|nr:centrin, EF-hand protein [Datura stramonium]